MRRGRLAMTGLLGAPWSTRSIVPSVVSSVGAVSRASLPTGVAARTFAAEASAVTGEPTPSAATAVPSWPVRTRVLAILSMGAVRLPGLRDHFSQFHLRARWSVSLDRDWLILTRPGLLDARFCVNKRGVIVLVNCDVNGTRDIMAAVRTFAAALPHGSATHTSDYVDVEVDPYSTDVVALKDDVLRMRDLDAGSVKVLAELLAQSVILQHHELAVEKQHDSVEKLNEIIRDAKLEQVRRATLTEALAGNATTRDQLISIGTATLKRPGSLAWGSERYDELLSVVSEHLELDSRVAELENKLSFVDELNKWCLQERGNAGMERLVVLIVLILSVELVISVTETYEKFFKHPKDRHGADTAMETTGEVVRA